MRAEVCSVRCQAVTKSEQLKKGKPRFGVGLHRQGVERDRGEEGVFSGQNPLNGVIYW